MNLSIFGLPNKITATPKRCHSAEQHHRHGLTADTRSFDKQAGPRIFSPKSSRLNSVASSKITTPNWEARSAF